MRTMLLFVTLLSTKAKRAYTTTRKMILLLTFISMATFDATTAVCPAPDAEIGLNPMSGTLGYERKGVDLQSEWCGWNVLKESLTDHVIILKLTSLSINRDEKRCFGELSLTGYFAFCEKPVPTCYIYASQRSCEHLMTSDLVKNENCTNLYWHSEKRKIWRIKYRSRKTARETSKLFSFDYKFISCKQVDEISKESFMTSSNRTAKSVSQIHSGISIGTLAGVVAFFILLLATAVVLLFLLYRRVRKLKSQTQSRARVQYELAKPRDITVLQSSNTEQTNDSPSRKSTYSLHGEHHTINSENDVSVTHAEPAERNYSSIEDLSLGDEATPTFSTLPLERRQSDSADETCVYATINKRRATTKR